MRYHTNEDGEKPFEEEIQMEFEDCNTNEE
jgi:hypothetical protein